MKPNLALILAPLIVLGMLLIVRLIRKPALSGSPGGRILAFCQSGLVPLVLIAEGTTLHFEQAKTLLERSGGSETHQKERELADAIDNNNMTAARRLLAHCRE